MGDAQRSRYPRGGDGPDAAGAASANLHAEVKSVLDGRLEEYSKGIRADTDASISRMRDDLEGRNRALMGSYDKVVQQRLEGHDQAIAKMQTEIVQLRLQRGYWKTLARWPGVLKLPRRSRVTLWRIRWRWLSGIAFRCHMWYRCLYRRWPTKQTLRLRLSPC